MWVLILFLYFDKKNSFWPVFLLILEFTSAHILVYFVAFSFKVCYDFDVVEYQNIVQNLYSFEFVHM